MRIQTFAALALLGTSFALLAGPASADTPVTAASAVWDGSRDFDFEMGKWTMHNRRLVRKFSNSHDWAEFDSYNEGSLLPGGMGNQDIYRTDYFQQGFVGLIYRLYYPRTGLWSIYWIDNLSMQGTFLPPVVGKFEGNVGVFEGPDSYDSKPIVLRYTWTVNPKSSPITSHFEQAFSADGGKTWEPNFTNDLTPAGK